MAARRKTRAREAQLAFEALSIEGGLLSPDWLSRVAQLAAGGQSEPDYRILKGLNLRDEIGRYWRIAQAHWSDFAAGRATKADVLLLAERFVEALLRDSFGFGTLANAEPVVLAERSYPIGFVALGGRVPVIIAPAGGGLDTLATAFGDGTRRRSGFGLAQEYLNAADGAMWGLASDGLTLRIVRDNASLTRPAWIEADLQRIFTEERYADFAALWLLAHETRFGRAGQPVAECALETWRNAGREEGTKARDKLRFGVEDALVALGQGFLAHPDNQSLRTALQSGALATKDYFNQLLRLVYRLIFLLTVEERGVLHPDGAGQNVRSLYAVGYSLRRLSERSVKRSAHDRFLQREMFKPRELLLKPSEGTGGPRLWFRRLVICSESNTKPIQDVQFGPGLNIIWSPDPADRSAEDGGAAPSGSGHGAGKTLVCRLLRYCLGEAHFASDVLRTKISSAFKEGRVGVEVIVDGVEWVVVRSIGVFGHDVVLEGGTPETALAPGITPTGMDPFVEMLADCFITPEVAALISDSPKRAWLLAVAWLTRDQECHFGKVMEWRAAGAQSGSPAHGLSVSNATNIVRALMGAITPREHQLAAAIERFDTERNEEARGVERRRWLIEESLKRILKEVELQGRPIPEGDLLGPFLRSAASARVARVAVVDAKGELTSVADLEAQYENAQKEVERLTGEVSKAESARSNAEAVAKLIASETPGLTASLDEAETPTCPVCEVPIDHALVEGCKLSHKLPQVASLRQRREKNERDLRDKHTEERAAEESLKRLRPGLTAATVQRDKAWKNVRTARRLRDDRTDAWYEARRVGDDVGDLEKLLTENAVAEKKVAQLDETIKQRRKDVGTERDQHAQVFIRLGEHFDPLVRRLLGRDPDASGRVQHDGNWLQLIVDYGGERTTPAIDLVKVLAFDLATLCRSVEGATKLPGLLIHDSPRSSDLGLSIYHELFHLVRELEDVGSSPQFQYIVTTTSRPPDDLAGDERVRLQLNGSPAEARLFRRDL